MYLTQILFHKLKDSEGCGRIVSAGKDAIAKVRIASCPMGKCSENSLSFFVFFFAFGACHSLLLLFCCCCGSLSLVVVAVVVVHLAVCLVNASALSWPSLRDLLISWPWFLSSPFPTSIWTHVLHGGPR